MSSTSSLIAQTNLIDDSSALRIHALSMMMHRRLLEARK